MSITSNVSNDVAIIHYGYESYLPYKTNALKPKPSIANKGCTYLSFSRSKNIGNVLNLTYTGNLPDLYVGDWIVLKTTANGSFDLTSEETPNSYLNKGIVRFIGQIYLINSQFNTDADGILKKTYNINIREWSHCLNIPVRFSSEIALVNGESEIVQAKYLEAVKAAVDQSGVKSVKVEELKAEKFNALSSLNKSAFELVAILFAIAGVSSFISKQYEIFGEKKVYLTTSRLPKIPKAIYDDHILELEGEEYEEDVPFATGFMESLIGVQKWTNVELNKKNLLVFDENFNNILEENSTRPTALINIPDLFASGVPLPEIIKKLLDTGGEYEVFSDLMYFEQEGLVLCKPMLSVRDKPIALKCLADSKDLPNYKKSEEGFGFTYKDDLPRITIPLNHVLSMANTYSSQEAFNYIQFQTGPSSLDQTAVLSQSLRFGRYKDLLAQEKFGGQEYFATINETLTFDKHNDGSEASPEQVKVTEPKNKQSTESKEGSDPENTKEIISNINWLTALVEKYKYYMPIKYALPHCTMQIIDNDFPISAGMMVRVELGPGFPTICGEVEEYSFTTTISGEGRLTNRTYVKLIDLMMENPKSPKQLIPLPKEFSKDLFVKNATNTLLNNEYDQLIKTIKE